MDLTRERIRQLPASPMLDALAAAVMYGGTAEHLTSVGTDDPHSRFWCVKVGNDPGSGYRDRKPFSTDLSTAWPLLEAMPKVPDDDSTLPRGLIHAYRTVSIGHDGYLAGWLFRVGDSMEFQWYGQWLGVGETPALAICRAALLAALK